MISASDSVKLEGAVDARGTKILGRLDGQKFPISCLIDKQEQPSQKRPAIKRIKKETDLKGTDSDLTVLTHLPDGYDL